MTPNHTRTRAHQQGCCRDNKNRDQHGKSIGDQAGNGGLQQKNDCRHEQKRTSADQQGRQGGKCELFGNFCAQELKLGLQQSRDVL